MVGIISYGAYVPWYRIDRNIIHSAVGFLGATPLPGEKSVANWDEDCITMAVAAGIECLNNSDRHKVDRLHFATTTQPYTIRQNSDIVAAALDLRSDVGSTDITGSNKAGTRALLSGLDAAAKKESENVLICASDCRLSKPGGSLEYIYGDGAASILVGQGEVIAVFEGSYSISYDFPDRWRGVGERYEHLWEERFVRDVGYTKFIPQAILGLMKKYSLNVEDFAKIAYPCPYAREHANIAKKIGAEPQQIQDTLLSTVGDSGSAYSLMMLVAALEDAKPGDRILIASYGNGSDALSFRVTDTIEVIRDRGGLRGPLARKKGLTVYEKYLAFRDIIPLEVGLRGQLVANTAMSALWRERKTVYSLYGSRCKQCGTPQYPPNRVCVNPDCDAIDEMEDYRFSDKRAELVTYTADNLAFSINPPTIYGIVDFEGGGRYWFDITDCDIESLRVGMPVKMTFRIKYYDKANSILGYHWKATPLHI